MKQEEIKNWLQENCPDYLTKPSDLLDKIINYGSDKNGFASEILTYCNNEANLDIFDLLNSQDINRYDKWLLLDILAKTIDRLKINHASFIEFLRRIYPFIKNDALNGILHGSIKEYASNHPKEAYELVTTLEKINEDFSSFYLIPVLEGIAKVDYDLVIEKCNSYLDSGNEKYVCCGLSILALLDYSINSRLSSIIKLLHKFKDKQKTPIIYGALTYCYSSLWKYDNSLILEIIDLQKLNLPEIDYQVSLFLFFQLNMLIEYNIDLFHELLLALAEVDYQYKGTISNIDMALFNICNRSNIWREFLEKWIINHEMHMSGEKSLSQTLPSFISKLCEDYEVISKLITEFLNSENQSHHLAAADIICYYDLRYRQSLSLNIDVLNQLNDTDCMYIAGKIIGYIYDVKNLLTLMFALLAKKSISDRLWNKIQEYYLNIIAPEYINETFEFMHNIISNKTLTYSKNQIKMAKIVKKALATYKDTISNLSLLNEFKVSSQKLLKINIIRNKKMREIMKQSEEKSVLLPLFSRMYIRQGKGSFHIQDGKLTEVSYMKKHSAGYTLPLTSFADPIGNDYMYIQLRLEKKGDIN